MKEKVLLLALGITFGLILSAAILLLQQRQDGTPVILNTRVPKGDILFEIYGAVKTPGLYSSPEDIRVKDAVALAGGFSEDADPEQSHLSGWVADGSQILIPTAAAVQPTLTLQPRGGLKIDLNAADMETLMSLPGIGEKKAADIIALREQKGRFERPEELLEISGISEATLAKFYDMISVH